MTELIQWRNARNNYRVATFSQHHHPGHKPFPLMALKVSHSSCKRETLNCAAKLFTTTPMVARCEAGRWPIGEVISLNKISKA